MGECNEVILYRTVNGRNENGWLAIGVGMMRDGDNGDTLEADLISALILK